MKHLKILFILLFATLSFSAGQAQKSKLRKANKFYKKGMYAKAIPFYEAGLKDAKLPKSMEKLANCYYNTGDSENAEAWFEKTIESGIVSKDVLNKYTRSLQRNGKYEEAIDRLNNYAEVYEGGSVPKNFRASLEMAKDFERDYTKFQVKPLPQLNTAHSEVAEIATANGIIFSSNASLKSFGKKKKGGQAIGADYNFFAARMLSSNFYSDVKPIQGSPNSKFDELGASMSPDGQKVYYSRKVISKDKKDRKEVIEILEARVDPTGKWIEEKLINSLGAESISNARPAVHPDGNTIVFASDRVGGYGNFDLYVVRREGDGWTDPVNLGEEINTLGNEDFPSFNERGELFFASDGKIGFGGYDVFSTAFNNGTWGNTENMGPVINSSRDDFGLIWEPGRSSGYLTSNRSGSRSEDIFYFERKPEIIGMVMDSMTSNPIKDVHLTLIDSEWREEFGNSDGFGHFNFFLKPRDVYQLWVRAPGYKQKKMIVSAVNLKQADDLVVNVKLAANKLLNLHGEITDAETGEGLEDVVLNVKNEDGVPETKEEGEDNGNYLLKLTGNNDFTVIVRKEGYVPRVMMKSLKDVEGLESEKVDLEMKKGDYMLVQGHVRRLGRGNLEGAKIYLMDNTLMAPVDSVVANENGTFWTAVPWDSTSNYSIIASKPGFFSFSKHLETREDKEIEVDLLMAPAEYGLDKVVKVIYYDYNKSRLDLLSKRDLNELYYFMVQNPESRLEVRSFTDCRGSDEYNRKLSIKRSKAVEEFIISRRSIPQNRIKSIGFGESFLINDCDDGVDCSEEEHAQNRRTEIVVLDR